MKELHSITENSKTDAMYRFVALELKSLLFQSASKSELALETELKAIKICQIDGKPSTEAAQVQSTIARLYYYTNDKQKAKESAEKVLEMKKVFAAGQNKQLLDGEISLLVEFINGEKSQANRILAAVAAENVDLQEVMKLYENDKLDWMSNHIWVPAAESVIANANIFVKHLHEEDARNLMTRYTNDMLSISMPGGKERTFPRALCLTADWWKDRDPVLSRRCCLKGIEMAEKFSETSSDDRKKLYELRDYLFRESAMKK